MNATQYDHAATAVLHNSVALATIYRIRKRETVHSEVSIRGHSARLHIHGSYR
jgi:hypothetical protein